MADYTKVEHCPITSEDEMFALVTSEGDLGRVYPIVWKQRELDASSCDIRLVDRSGMPARYFPEFMNSMVEQLDG